jgi:hypothetical protein
MKIKNYIIDIDGVICENIPNEEPERMVDAKEIEGAREWINSLYDQGHNICFFTARLPIHAEATERWLSSHGFKYHSVVYGKPRGGEYFYVDNLKVQASRFKGRFSPIVKKSIEVEVFDD